MHLGEVNAIREQLSSMIQSIANVSENASASSEEICATTATMDEINHMAATGDR